MHPSHDGASLRAHRHPLSSTTTLLLIVVLAFGAFLGIAPRAAASTARASTSQSTSQTQQRAAARQRFRTRADRVLSVTRNQAGDPYRYGASGPGAFDCSGLVMYVYRHALNRSLPHNAEMQYRASTHIRRRNLRPGDLVFEMSGGQAYHVGIYAGHGYIWHAPHSGTVVKRQKMYPSHWAFGRLIHSTR